MSIRSPEIKPITIPSFFPRISPNEATTMINKFGATVKKGIALNVVVCKTKHIEIIINRTYNKINGKP